MSKCHDGADMTTTITVAIMITTGATTPIGAAGTTRTTGVGGATTIGVAGAAGVVTVTTAGASANW